MADLPSYPDTGDDTGVRPDRESPPGMPRWVKISGIIVLVLVLLFVIIMFTGIGGSHGPNRHGSGSITPASSITAALTLSDSVAGY